MATSSRSSFISSNTNSRRGGTSFSSPTPSIQPRAVPSWGPSPSSIATSAENASTPISSLTYKKKLSLNLTSITNNSFESLSGFNEDNGSGTGSGSSNSNSIHPLFNTWDVWFSHRNANSNGGNKNNNKREDASQVGKESKEIWEEGVVNLGGFSSIESLHPFLAHLTPSSLLPASLNSSSVISDVNIFRAAISPSWEDAMNSGGGRIFLRLRKGVADRIWEEVVYAMVGERISSGENGIEDESIESSIGNKVNGAVLSVRKDEDILSLWTAPCTRQEREAIRESLKSALEPLLTPTSLTNLTLDYKPHPVSSHLNPNPSTPHNNNNNHHNNHSHSNNTRESGGNHHNNHNNSSNRRGGHNNSNNNNNEDRESRGERGGHHNSNNNGERSERVERGERREGGTNNRDHNSTTDTRDRPSRTGGFASYRIPAIGDSPSTPSSTTEPKSDYTRNSTNPERTERTESYSRSSGTNNSSLRESRGSGSSGTTWGRS